MNIKKVESVVQSILKEAAAVRQVALEEYAQSDNVFENFEDTAARLGLRREEVAYIFLDKHMRGIASYIRGKRDQRDSIRGRIIDALNYLLLLGAMLEEEEMEWEYAQENEEEI